MQRPVSAPSTTLVSRSGSKSSTHAGEGGGGTFTTRRGGKNKKAEKESDGWERFCGKSVRTLTVKDMSANRRHVTLLESVFPNRAPVLYFSYEGKPVPDRLIQDKHLPKMYFHHSNAVHSYNCVLNTLRKGGLYSTTHGSGKWCLLWASYPKPEFLRNYHPFQKTNHFPGSWNLGRKDLVWRHVARMRRAHGAAFHFHPHSFILPEDSKQFQEVQAACPKAIWIFKPNMLSCGKGIRLLTGSKSPAKLLSKPAVVQRYISSPLLISGYKFDLRLYVVVTSIDPLKIYVFKEGLVRFATEKYCAKTSTLGRTKMHLTNYSVNKHADNYIKNMDSPTRPKTDRSFHGNGSNSQAPTSASGEDYSSSSSAFSEDKRRSLTPIFGKPKSRECDESAEADTPSGGDTPTMLKESKPRLGSYEIPRHRQDYKFREPAPESCGPMSDDDLDSEASSEEVDSSKWSLEELKQYFDSQGWNFGGLRAQIYDLVIKSLLAVEPTLVTSWHRGATFVNLGQDTQKSGGAHERRGAGDGFNKIPNQNCFEMYGFDVLIDDKFKPWLLEVNVSPSLSSSSPLDKRIKTMLVADMLTLAGIRPFDHKTVEHEVKVERLSRLLGISSKGEMIQKNTSKAPPSASDTAQTPKNRGNSDRPNRISEDSRSSGPGVPLSGGQPARKNRLSQMMVAGGGSQRQSPSSLGAASRSGGATSRGVPHSKDSTAAINGSSTRKQKMPKTTRGGSFSSTGSSTSRQESNSGASDKFLIDDFADEVFRRGNFDRVYPTLEAVDKYSPLFASQRHSNAVLGQWLKMGGEHFLHQGPPARSKQEAESGER